MANPVEDRRIRRVRPLITPDVLAEQVPASRQNFERVADSRRAIERILEGKDRRKIVIVGPCSIHDPKAAIEYASALKQRTKQFGNLLVVVRVYFEKQLMQMMPSL